MDLSDAGPSSHGKGAHDSVAAILGSFVIFAGSLGGNLGRFACMPGLQRNSLGKVPLFVVPTCTCYAAEDARHFGQVCCIVLYILSTGVTECRAFRDMKPLPVSVRVGQAVDVVGQAGRPKTITGFATHTTPVLLAYEQV